jgi:predicted kinase
VAPIYLIEGPVGAGKSTHARKLALQVRGVHLALDEWFVRLFSPDRPAGDFIGWYLEHKTRLLDLMWAHALAIAGTEVSPILELGLIQRQARLEFLDRARDAGADLKVRLLDAPLEVRWERVSLRNETRGDTFSMVVPRQVFDVASSMWECPDEDEVREYRIEVLTRDEA